jgi:hypothetical protein
MHIERHYFRPQLNLPGQALTPSLFIRDYWDNLGIIYTKIFLVLFSLHNLYYGAGTQRQITQRNCYKTSMLLNVYVPKRIITKRSCHTTKAVIKRQTSQKVNITKHKMFQNITSQNENCHKTTKNI